MQYTNLKSNFQKPGAGDIMKWMLGLHGEKRPRAPATGVPVPFVENDGKELKKNNDTLTWIGQASFLIQLGGLNILIDPVLSRQLGWIRRNSPPGLDWTALPRVDVVLITHNHRDHMDAATLRRLGVSPLYIVPKGLRQWFLKRGYNRVIELGWWEAEEISRVRISFVPAEHWSRRSLFDSNTSWWGGYVLEFDGLKIYHSGDTGWFDGFREIGERFSGLHAALLPIGAYAPRWFMHPQHINPDEAVNALKTLNAKNLIPMHWGTFKLSDEPLNEPPLLLKTAWDNANLAESDLKMLPIGYTTLIEELT